MSARCPGRERLDLYLEGELGRAERRRIGAHLARCPECRDLAGERRALLGAFSTLPAVEVPAGFANRVMARLPAEAPLAARRRRFRGLPAFLASGATAFLASLLVYYLATGRGLFEIVLSLGRSAVDVFSLAVPVLARAASLLRVAVDLGGELASALGRGLHILSGFLTPATLAFLAGTSALLGLFTLFGIRRILSLGEKS